MCTPVIEKYKFVLIIVFEQLLNIFKTIIIINKTLCLMNVQL